MKNTGLNKHRLHEPFVLALNFARINFTSLRPTSFAAHGAKAINAFSNFSAASRHKAEPPFALGLTLPRATVASSAACASLASAGGLGSCGSTVGLAALASASVRSIDSAADAAGTAYKARLNSRGRTSNRICHPSMHVSTLGNICFVSNKCCYPQTGILISAPEQLYVVLNFGYCFLTWRNLTNIPCRLEVNMIMCKHCIQGVFGFW